MKIMYSSRWKRHGDQPTHAHSENFSRCNDEHILLLKLHSAHFQWICKSIFVNENVGKNCIIVCVQNHFSEVWLQVKTEWQKSSSDRTEAPCFFFLGQRCLQSELDNFGQFSMRVRKRAANENPEFYLNLNRFSAMKSFDFCSSKTVQWAKLFNLFRNCCSWFN